MAWRDRLRRRAPAPDAGDRPTTAPTGATPGADADPGSTVPGDWDGGWRRTAPPRLTVARSPLGVSDGLVFRSGLTSWQNPSFDSGLGHAVLPAAPAGLLRGVARPATPRSTQVGGGPLLLRALRPEGAADLPSPATEQPPRDLPNTPVRNGRSADAATRAPDLTATASPAVLPTPTPAPPVQRAVSPTEHRTPPAPPIPLVRRVTALPPTPGPTLRGRGEQGAPTPAVQRATERGGRQETPPGTVPRTATRPAQGDGTSQASAPAVRPLPVSRSLTAARRTSGPVRRITVLPPSTPAPVQRATPAEPPSPAPPSTPDEVPVRGGLDVQLSALPPSTQTPGAETPGGAAPAPSAVPGPAMPVVQRQADGTAEVADAGGSAEVRRSGGSGEERRSGGTAAVQRSQGDAGSPSTDVSGKGVDRSAGAQGTAPPASGGDSGAGARVRGGLGAPMSALPPSTEVPGPAVPAPGAVPGPVLPVVQRQVDGAAEVSGSGGSAEVRRPGGSAPVQRSQGDAGVRSTDVHGKGVDRNAGSQSTDLPGKGVDRSAGSPSTDLPGKGVDRSPGVQGTTPPAPGVGSGAGARVRGGLGAPMSALPPSAAVPGAATPAPGAAPGPVMPVVQRQADGTADTPRPQGTARPSPGAGARARGGLGAPMPALPPSAEVPGAPGVPAPAVQRAPARKDSGSPATPLPSTGVGGQPSSNPPSDSPSKSAPGSSPGTPSGASSGDGADAPLLGADAVVQLAGDARAGGGAAEYGAESATPLVAPFVAQPSAVGSPEGAGGDGHPSSGGQRPGTRPGGQRRSGVPGSPGPVVVARTVAGVSERARSQGADPVTGTRPAAHLAPAAQRTLHLLPVRQLALSTGDSEGAAPPVVARSGGRPVVAARWPGGPVPGEVAGVAARPVPGPSPVAAASPPERPPTVQRAVAGPSAGAAGPGAGTTGGSPGAVRRVPVVRPASPGQGAGTTVQTRALPVTAPQAPPLADRPPHAPAPAEPVPVVLPVTVRSATPVQRDVSDTTGAGLLMGGGMKKKTPPAPPPSAAGVLMGEPAKGGPASGRSRAGTGKGAERREQPAPDAGLDLDDLARRLLDPMARLLRTELRRGRERTGRPYDGRR
ncbi:hypothetical protein [Streptomyces sp. NPDC087294]|uniref:hypothetical protein n=1 Tax=Streptomyces sp. NPDC087294 TaxID=3365777 RepID=UPI003803D5C6